MKLLNLLLQCLNLQCATVQCACVCVEGGMEVEYTVYPTHILWHEAAHRTLSLKGTSLPTVMTGMNNLLVCGQLHPWS